MQAGARVARRFGLAGAQLFALPSLTSEATSLPFLASQAGGWPDAKRQQQLPAAAQQLWLQQPGLHGTAACAAPQHQRRNFAGFREEIGEEPYMKEHRRWACCLRGPLPERVRSA